MTPVKGNDYISAAEFASEHGIAERTARNYCAQGKIEGAFLTGKTWNIPIGSSLPKRRNGKTHKSALLTALQEQQKARLHGNIYHRTQIELTYNSNHMEGSRLTHEQTRFIFETNTIGVERESLNIDDIIETCNHFRCIDMIIERAEERLSEALIWELHRTLKSGTSDARKEWFAVGEYKKLPNEVGGMDTTEPEDVARFMKQLIRGYNGIRHKKLDDILHFHHRFECIHPFQDGNGQIGRLIMFKECLANDIIPFIITDNLKSFYYRGLQFWLDIPGYLRDTCLTAQDDYRRMMKKYRIGND